MPLVLQSLLLACVQQHTLDLSGEKEVVADPTPQTDSLPGEAVEHVNLIDANPFNPDASYVWQIDVSDDMMVLMNANGYSGWYGDVDTHIQTWAETITVSTVNGSDSVVFEQPEMGIGGEMNFCELPCKAQLIVDLNEFTDDQTMGGYDNVKFGNMLYGGPYAEYFLYNAFFPSQGITTPSAAYAWVEPSYLYGQRLDYLVMEMTKEDFLTNRYGEGGWLMAYEGYGDIGYGSGYYPTCQAGDCDDAVLDELSEDIVAALGSVTMLDFLDRRYLGGHEQFFNYCAAEKMVGQWDGYCDAAHNYTMVVLPNAENPDQPIIDLVPHSLDLTLNPDWSWDYGVFGSGTIISYCGIDADCSVAYVDHLEDKAMEWDANVDVYEAQIEGQNEYLTSIDMQYGDYESWKRANFSFIEGRADTILTTIGYWRDPCSEPEDTGWWMGGGGWDTGGYDPCAPQDTGGGFDTGSVDTGSGGDTGAPIDTGDVIIDTATADTGA